MTQGLERILRSTLGGIYYTTKRDEIAVLDDLDSYVSYIEVDVSDRTRIECPLCLISTIVSLIQSHPELTKLIIPLQRYHQWRGNEPCKSIDSALKQVFEAKNGYTLNKAIISNITFYGTPGLLLDSAYNALMMVTVHLNYDTMKFSDYTVTIPPDVYFNKDKLSQGIIKKLVPYYLEAEVNSDFRLTIATRADLQPIVTFKSIDNYITFYNMPFDYVSPNEVLRNNIETLKLSLNHVF